MSIYPFTTEVNYFFELSITTERPKETFVLLLKNMLITFVSDI